MTADAANVQDGVRIADQLELPNPCLRFLPEVETLDDGFEKMECIPSEHSQDARISEDDFQIPTFEHARLAVELVAAVRQSAAERNLNSADFRRTTISAGELINHVADRHGRTMPAARVTVEHAVPRGLFAVVPAGVGQRALRSAVQRIFGTKPEPVDVELPEGGLIRYLRLPSLCVPFPSKPTPRSFAKDFLSRFNSAMNRRFTGARGPLHRGEEDINAALPAYGIAANLGLLIVEQINTRAAGAHAASALWDTLAQFTMATGIPILCLATPGAAAALSEQSGAIAALASKTVYHMAPALPDSEQWTVVAAYLYARHLRRCLGDRKPDWFSQGLWRLTLGHQQLAAKVCTHIASVSRKDGDKQPSESEFMKEAAEALVLEMPHLMAVRKMRSGGSFTVSSVRRHGDWLPLEAVMQSVPGLEEADTTLRIVAACRTEGGNDA